jgi:hypothetical protein
MVDALLLLWSTLAGLFRSRVRLEAIQPNEHQPVEIAEGKSLRGLAPQHIDLLREDQAAGGK